MTYTVLQKKLHDHPFRPFRIRIVNSTLYDIREPWMIMIGETSAVIATQTRKDDKGYEVVLDWRTVSIQHMMELSDLDPPNVGSRKKAS
jgi:hypothetical protein